MILQHSAPFHQADRLPVDVPPNGLESSTADAAAGRRGRVFTRAVHQQRYPWTSSCKARSPIGILIPAIHLPGAARGVARALRPNGKR